MSPSWVTLVFEAANFLLLAAVLGWAFFRPVRAALERRRVSLEAEEQAAADKLAEAERELSDVDRRRSDFEASLAALRKRAREEAERERQRLLEAAREQAQREREGLKAELAALRRGQARRSAGDAAAAARQIVALLLERIQGPDLEDALLEAARHELDGLAGGGSLAPVIVESSDALDPAVLDSLASSARVARSELSARQVAELGPGFRILTARGLVDASAAGLAAHAERSLLARFEEEAVGDG